MMRFMKNLQNLQRKMQSLILKKAMQELIHNKK